MTLASRRPQLTDELLLHTLHAAEPSAGGADWLTLAEIERRAPVAAGILLAEDLVARLEDLGYTVRLERRAA